jgi:hypothetical protein
MVLAVASRQKQGVLSEPASRIGHLILAIELRDSLYFSQALEAVSQWFSDSDFCFYMQRVRDILTTDELDWVEYQCRGRSNGKEVITFVIGLLLDSGLQGFVFLFLQGKQGEH